MMPNVILTGNAGGTDMVTISIDFCNNIINDIYLECINAKIPYVSQVKINTKIKYFDDYF